MNSITSVQDLGIIVKGLGTRIKYEDQHDPMIFMHALSALLNHDIVVDFCWHQVSKLGESNKRTLNVNILNEFTGVGIKLKDGEEAYFTSLMTEYDDVEGIYPKNIDFLAAGTAPQDLSHFMNILLSGKHDAFLLNSFGIGVEVSATKDCFVVAPL